MKNVAVNLRKHEKENRKNKDPFHERNSGKLLKLCIGITKRLCNFFFEFCCVIEANNVLDSTETFTLPLFCLKKLDCKLENKKKVALNKFNAESTSNSFPIDKPKENFVDTINLIFHQ
jgi:hypothetical protein